MRELDLTNNEYKTQPKDISLMARMVPSTHFWLRFLGIILKCGSLAKKGKYDRDAWLESSCEVYEFVEDVGIKVQVKGIENLNNVDGPCIIIGNHMSMLETVLLPALVLPSHFMTYVLKESLTQYPIFRDVIDVCKPIAITRTNPRQDLKTVMNEGVAHIKNGTSVVIFPQSTRSHIFDPAQMSSIGVKLAKKAAVPVVPLALKTDALKNGKIVKDIGRIDTSIPVHFEFGKSLTVAGKGDEEQALINSFIEGKIENWAKEIAVTD